MKRLFALALVSLFMIGCAGVGGSSEPWSRFDDVRFDGEDATSLATGLEEPEEVEDPGDNDGDYGDD